MIPRRAWRAVHGRPQGSTPRSRRGVPPPLHRLAYLQAGVPRPPPLHPPAPPDGHSAARIDISARPSAAARHPRGAVTPTAAGARPTPPRTPPAAAAAATAGDRTPPSGRAAVGGVEGGAWHPPPPAAHSRRLTPRKRAGPYGRSPWASRHHQWRVPWTHPPPILAPAAPSAPRAPKSGGRGFTPARRQRHPDGGENGDGMGVWPGAPNGRDRRSDTRDTPSSAARHPPPPPRDRVQINTAEARPVGRN